MRPFRFHSDNLNETLFEHRNKEYGAYEIRKSYHTRVLKSFLLSLSFIALVFGIPVLIQCLSNKPVPKQELFVTTPVDLKTNFLVEQRQLDPLTARSIQRNAASVTFRVTSDSLLPKEPGKTDTLRNTFTSSALTSNNTNDTVQGNSKDTLALTGNRETTGLPFTASTAPFNLAAVEKVPVFPGGEPSMMAFLQRNIHYNELAKDAKVTGRIYASFIINSKGNIEGIKIIRGLGYGLDEEVIRVLNTMPAWEPGYYQGKPVSTIMNIPVSFNLIQ